MTTEHPCRVGPDIRHVLGCALIAQASALTVLITKHRKYAENHDHELNPNCRILRSKIDFVQLAPLPPVEWHASAPPGIRVCGPLDGLPSKDCLDQTLFQFIIYSQVSIRHLPLPSPTLFSFALGIRSNALPASAQRAANRTQAPAIHRVKIGGASEARLGTGKIRMQRTQQVQGKGAPQKRTNHSHSQSIASRRQQAHTGKRVPTALFRTYGRGGTCGGNERPMGQIRSDAIGCVLRTNCAKHIFYEKN
jgi:hypothetical protein